MHFKLIFNDNAKERFLKLQNTKSKKNQLKAVLKTLGLMETNLRHPSLQTHEFYTLKGPEGEKIFESYVQNNTPGAYRIFWYYGPQKSEITIVEIIPHP